MKNFHYITTTQCLNENPVQARFWIADFGMLGLIEILPIE